MVAAAAAALVEVAAAAVVATDAINEALPGVATRLPTN